MILSFHVAPTIFQEKVTLENQEKEEELQTSLENLHRHFSKLMVVVRSSLDHKLQHQQLVLVDFIRWIEHQMNWVGELSDVTDLNDLFKKLHPYFDFIQCKLIVDTSEEFLNNECYGEDKKNLVSELKEYMVKAKSLRCSSTVKELKVQLRNIYSPYLTNLSNMPQIQIELHNPWNEATIEQLYLLIGHLLPYKSKQSILKYIEIETGSVRIKYIVHESKADCLIRYAQDKIQFMRLIGVFALTINGESILQEDENMNFTFKSALLKAAKAGHNEAIQFILKLGADVDYFNNEGSTALILASEGGHEQVVQTLVSAGTNVNIQDNIGRTALMLGSLNGHTRIAKILLKENADVNIQEEDGYTALMLASQKGHTEVAEILLKQNAEVNIQTKIGSTALMLAIQNGHIDIAELILKANADINIQNKNGVTALMLASQNGDTRIAEILLKEKADVNVQEKDGYTALMLASQNGHTDIAELLLKANADVKIQNKDGVTALILASQSGHTRIAEILLKESAVINIQAKNGGTALMIASQNGHTRIAEILLKENAEVNIQTKIGSTALMLAIQNGHIDIAELILKANADINIQNKNGVTALMLASQNGDTRIAEILLKEKADVNVQEKDGYTALILASQNGHANIAELLLKANADVNVQKINGVTALMLASQNGHAQVVDLLVEELVDIDAQEKSGKTALMLASINGHLQVAECLLQSHADPHVLAYDGSIAFSLAAYSGNRDLVNMLLDKAEPTTDEIEKAIVTSCYGGQPTLITSLSNKLTHLTNDQRELLDSCVKGDLGAVIWKTLDSPDTPLVLGLTPLMVASSCGHVDIVDALIQAGADVNKQESHLGFTPLFFAVKGGQSSLIVETLLMYGANPNIIATTNESPLDVAISVSETFEINAISELLIKYGGQTTLQSQGRNKSQPKTSFLILDELVTTPKSLQATHEATVIKSFKDKGDVIKRKPKQEILSFSSFIDLFT